MEGLPQILVAVIPIYILMVVGGGLRRVRVLGPEMDDGLTKLVIHVLYLNEMPRHGRITNSWLLSLELSFSLELFSEAIRGRGRSSDET